MKKIIILISTIMLFSCSGSNQDKSIIIKPHEYNEIEHLKINWIDSLNQNTNNYLIYFYQNHCAHCYDIKNEVITYALEGKIKIYFCNDINIVFYEGDLNETIGKSNIDEVFINGTPSIIEVKQKVVKDNVCGSNKVLKKIRGQ